MVNRVLAFDDVYPIIKFEPERRIASVIDPAFEVDHLKELVGVDVFESRTADCFAY